MKFDLSFNMDNDAFFEEPEQEIIRILSLIAGKLKGGHDQGVVMDINGNKIGNWSIA